MACFILDRTSVTRKLCRLGELTVGKKTENVVLFSILSPSVQRQGAVNGFYIGSVLQYHILSAENVTLVKLFKVRLKCPVSEGPKLGSTKSCLVTWCWFSSLFPAEKQRGCEGR